MGAIMAAAATNPDYRHVLTWSSARGRRWIGANALLGLLFSLFSQSGFLFAATMLFGIYAFCIGLLQGFVLFRSVRGFRFWLISSVIGFEIGALIVLLNWNTLIPSIDSGQLATVVFWHNIQLVLVRSLILALALSLAQMLVMLFTRSRLNLFWLLWPVASTVGIVLPGVAIDILLQSLFGVASLTSTILILLTLLAGMFIGVFYGACTGVMLRIIATSAR